MHHAFVSVGDSRKLVVRPGELQTSPTSCTFLRSYCEDGSVALYSCRSRNVWIVRGPGDAWAVFRAVGLTSISVGGGIVAGKTTSTNTAEYTRYGDYNAFAPGVRFTAFSHPVVNIDGTRAYHLWTHNTCYTDTNAQQTAFVTHATCEPRATHGPIVYGLHDSRLLECDTRDGHINDLDHSVDPRGSVRVIDDYLYLNTWRHDGISIEMTVYDLRARAAYHMGTIPRVYGAAHFYI